MEDAARIPEEKVATYPSHGMFGVLPAYGFYVRHVENVRFHNIDVSLAKKDTRPAFVFDNVRGLDLTGILGELCESADTLIKMNNIQNGLIHSCRAKHPGKTFLRISGMQTRQVTILNNDFSNVKDAVKCMSDVVAKAVFVDYNRMK